MTRPIEEHEISALIDGQLAPQRAAEVRAAIRQDPVLGTEYERLQAADLRWASAARTADFKPRVSLDRPSPSPDRATAWLVAALGCTAVAARLLPKVLPVDLPVAVGIHTLALIAVLAAVAWLSRTTPNATDAEFACVP
jgi:anti-sigma factor RsiW